MHRKYRNYRLGNTSRTAKRDTEYFPRIVKTANFEDCLYNTKLIDYYKLLLEVILIVGYKLSFQISIQATHKKYYFLININFYTYQRTWD